MKRCPTCGQVFDDSTVYCLNDGTPLVPDTGQQSGGGFQSSGEMPTQYLRVPQPPAAAPAGNPSNVLYLIIGILATALVGIGIYFIFLRDTDKRPENGSSNMSQGAKESPGSNQPIQATPGNNTNIPAAKPPSVIDPNLTAGGKWSGEISYPSGTAFSAQADFTDSGGGQVRGQIVWTVIRNKKKKDKVGMSATESVQGTFDAATRTLLINGYSVSDPDLIIKDKYRLILTPDGRSMSGASFGGKVPGRVSLSRF